MPAPARSSRRRYVEYRQRLKERAARKNGEVSAAHGSADAGGPSDRGEKNRKPRNRSFTRLFLEFWAMLAVFRGTLLLVLLGAAVSTVLGLVPLSGSKIVFDSVLRDPPLPLHYWPHWLPMPNGRRNLLIAVAGVMIVMAFASELLGLWTRWETTRITKRLQVGVRKDVFDHAVRLPLHRVYELKSGGVASILREDAGGVADLLFSLLYNPFKAIIQLIGSIAILAFVDWRLLIGSLALLPTVWLTHRTWISRIRPLFRDIRMTRQQMDAHATEAFGGMRVVRSFSRQNFESATFTRNGHLMARQEIFAWWWMRGIDLTWSILIPVALALLLLFGGLRVLHDAQRVREHLIRPGDALTIGGLVMFMSYLAALLGPIATLAGSATALQNSLSGLDRVLDLLAEPTEMPARPGAIEVDRDTVAGRVTIQNVSFAYNESAEPVLHEINLDVMAGEMIALVGPSGAGKTTLCNLVARFYDPTAGAILLDNVDLRDITADSYRRLLGVVEQDTFLFDGTVAANIAYGRRGATAAEIADAARQANAHDFIEKLPHGYDTFIGERGVKLSGGQRQRITIARAILADPRILILDEATSNLDTESERLIQSSLQSLMAGRTSFVIAHRLSTIRHADRIVVLENGRIVEQGRHDELIAASGRYRSMVEVQTAPPAPRAALGMSARNAAERAIPHAETV